MKKYRVSICSVVNKYYELEVEAISKGKAKERALENLIDEYSDYDDWLSDEVLEVVEV